MIRIRAYHGERGIIRFVNDSTTANEIWAVNPEIPIARGARNRIGFQLVFLGSVIEHLADSRLEGSGVDARGYCILATLSVDGPGSQHELARLLGKAPGVIVAEVDQLEAKGLVQRNRDPQDRRRSRVTLTDAGGKALAHADQIADEVIAELFHGLDADELAQLKALMNKGLEVEVPG
jgi:MarR family transcriptional regulator, lower aerobic nicotinate degradation pathway regulator